MVTVCQFLLLISCPPINLNLAVQICLAMCASCFVGFIESLVEYFNRYVRISGSDNVYLCVTSFYRYAYIEIGAKVFFNNAVLQLIPEKLCMERAIFLLPKIRGGYLKTAASTP